MTRKLLIKALRETAEHLGYTFHTGHESQIAARVKTFPAVWMSPLRITGVHGHRDCRVTYRVKLRFLTLGGFRRISDETLWQIVESDALSLYNTLAETDGIEHVAHFKATPSALFSTKSGDISTEVEFDIDTFHCI